MSPSLVLAVDSGNTAIKWGLHNGEQWVVLGHVLQNKRQSLKQAWGALPTPELVIISNVAGKQVADDLAALLELWQVEPRWIIASANQCGITNNYTQPEQLGCDRWAALIAVWHRVQQTSLVVDVGTAMTVDALSSTGRFLGGIIVPGPDSMRQVLVDRMNVSTILAEGCFQDFPINTQNALYSGVIQALCGAVQQMYYLLSDYSAGEERMPIEVILTGGKAALLAQYVSVPHRIVDNLVLEGLIVISQANK